ncbi:hypothetical protein K466DRAFT_356101 [Polyporus arcularius HHB13444]|uniref:Uncharacterized protein n=1 Tax=Polyporus arcularius HHB13444 TaxID=1314778 RepID=A0A5C3PMJ5_9APHY|nr:hypothetical protein K466DRAFT_356101 [Polyporus arcularius HHB13444]
MSLIYITWTTLSRRDALRDLRKTKRPSLQDILFCNGTIYFVVLFALNILHLVFSLTTLLTEEGTGISYLTQFATPLTSILISHFLLALQEANQVVVRVDPDDPLHTSRDPWDDTPSIIFSLGAFIEPDRPARSADYMEWDIDPHGEEEGGAEVVEVQAAETLSPPSSVTAPMLSATIAASSSLAAAPSSSSV